MSSRPFARRLACVRLRAAARPYWGRPAWRRRVRAGRSGRVFGALALALACWLGVIGAGLAAPGTETRVYKKIAPGEPGAGPRELRLFVDKPAGWKPGDRRPAVVFFFGGGWVGGTPEQFRPQSEYFASRGLVGIRVEYRTLPKGDSGPPVWCCADAKSAMRRVRSQAAELGIDPDRIAAAGGSAGGHLAAFTALVDGLDEPGEDRSVSCRPNALVLFNPVFNNGPGEWGHARVGDRFREFSPAHHVTSNAPPTVVFLGDADRLIPVRVVREFEASMRSVGARCEAHITPGAGHGFFNREPHLSRTLMQADRFLAALGWLQGAPTRVDPAAAAAASPAASPADAPAAEPSKGAGNDSAARARRPNVVFIMADDLGWRDVGFAGNTFVETPNLDRLAADGMRFTQAYQQTVCSPTRAALMTGQHPVRTGLTDYLKEKDTRFLSQDLPTLPRRLKAAGYRTGLVGKWHLTDDYTRPDGGNGRPQLHGWDEILCSETRPIGSGFYVPPYRHQPELEPMPGLEYLTDRLNYEAEEFIARNRDVPFFLYLAHYAPHTTLRGREEIVRRFERKPGAGRRTGPGSETNNPVLAAMIWSIDEGVGRIRARLEALGLAERTIVIFTSDNGGEAVRRQPGARGVTSVAPLRGGKSHLYEGGIRVPLAVAWPGVIRPGRVERTPVNGLDFYPTWLELAGLTPAPGQPLDGHSLVPLWRGTGPRPASPMFWHYPRTEPHFLGGESASALRDGDWKLIRFHADQRVELYQLGEDPGEQRDRSAAEPERARALAKRLDELLAAAASTRTP